MKLITRMLPTPRIGFSQVFRRFSTYNPFPGTDHEWGSNSFESADDFERQLFEDNSENGENSRFFRKLDIVEKAYRDNYGPTNSYGRDRYGLNTDSSELDRIEKAHSDSYGPTNSYGRNRYGLNTDSSASGASELFDDLDASFTSTEDGMDKQLEDAANYFEVNEEEIEKEDYSFRPDVEFERGMTYDIKDLDLTKPAVQKPSKRFEFDTTTEEVLQKADFRNVRFLANFITEGGIIIKRSKTQISAKAQRKIAREIKTARALGLMPFTTMGTKRFVYGKTMENMDEDFEFQTYHPHSFVNMGGTEDPFAA